MFLILRVEPSQAISALKTYNQIIVEIMRLEAWATETFVKILEALNDFFVERDKLIDKQACEEWVRQADYPYTIGFA